MRLMAWMGRMKSKKTTIEVRRVDSAGLCIIVIFKMVVISKAAPEKKTEIKGSKAEVTIL